MKRVLALYFSQTGQLGVALDSMLGGLDPEEFEVHVEAIQPTPAYPFPWSLGEFVGVFPESVLGIAPEIETPSFDPDAEWDLVILGYTVWYLAPSLPIQGFLQSDYARVLRGKPVVTLVACRNMWHTASERMKRDLAELGAELSDNVVVTDEGPTWATFVSTPRWMFTGKRDRFLRVFPPAGVSETTIEGLSRFGEALSARSGELEKRPVGPLLTGLGAVEIEERFVVPELIALVSFPPWAKLAVLSGPSGSIRRAFTLTLFALYLIFAILILIPVSIILRLLLYPFVAGPLRAYIERLRSPSGTAATEPDHH